MQLSLYLHVCALLVFMVQAMDIPNVCKEVTDSDYVVVNHLNSPVEANCDQVFNDIKTYFSKVEELIKCLKEDKNSTIDHCKEVVMEGEPKFMSVEFDYWKLMNGFKWNMTQVNTYMDWRDKSLYLWQRVDEASGRNSVYPKYK